jgi:hypothetical protein
MERIEPYCVPLIWADSYDGAVVSDILSMKNILQMDIYIMIGATIGQAAAVTLHKGTSVSSAATALAFTRAYQTGFVLDYDGPSVATPAVAAETISGAGGGAGTIYRDLGDRLICYGYNGTTFVDNETVTCSGGKTVVANGIQKNEDILVPFTVSSNTFNLNAAGCKLYKIPISADMLGEGYDCIELNIADANTTEWAAWALVYPRYSKEIANTVIYN